MDNYEINGSTMAVIALPNDKTKIIETGGTIIINKNAYKIIDDSCKYYGSTYKGRIKASKNLLDASYKLPFILEETASLIFFPTKSSLESDCSWIRYSSIKNIEKVSNMVSKVKFYNNTEQEFVISKLSLENQIVRSIRLEAIMKKRINDLIENQSI